MKKILHGVRYDTEKAVEIGETDNLNRGADSVTDFAFWEASLYRTPRSGRYFIAGRGGPMSMFSQSVGRNSWGGGADIIPLTKEEALEWAERHLSPECIEREFSDMLEDA